MAEPLVGPGRWRRAAPFALVGAAAVTSGLIGDLRPVWVLAAAAAFGVLILASLLVPWHLLPTSAQAAPPLAFFGVVAALMAAAPAGSSAGFAPLVLLPLMWLALYGTSRQVTVALAMGFATLGISWLDQHAGTPTADEAGRRMALLAAISVLLAWSTQRLVSQLADQRHRAAASELAVRDVAGVLRALHEAPDSQDGRHILCVGAIGRTGADLAMVLEPRADTLVATGLAGADAATAERLTQKLLAGPNTLLPLLDVDPTRRTAHLTSLLGAGSVLAYPVLQRGRTVALLVLCWHAANKARPHEAFVALLAVEAAVALERVELLEQLGLAARTDSLTGVANRRRWDQALPVALHGELWVALLDLDHFKQFNDSHGHPQGDSLLRDTAAAWAGHLGPGDLLARYGGEEFAVLLPGRSCDEARATVERLRTATPRGATCSIGLARWDGSEDAPSLVRRADQALYRAKSSGRDRTVTAPHHPTASIPGPRSAPDDLPGPTPR